MLLTVGAVVKMKKAHPCGSDLWKVTFVGSDIKMRCEGCGRVVMLERPVVEKRIKRIERAVSESSVQKSAVGSADLETRRVSNVGHAEDSQ